MIARVSAVRLAGIGGGGMGCSCDRKDGATETLPMRPAGSGWEAGRSGEIANGPVKNARERSSAVGSKPGTDAVSAIPGPTGPGNREETASEVVRPCDIGLASPDPSRAAREAANEPGVSGAGLSDAIAASTMSQVRTRLPRQIRIDVEVERIRLIRVGSPDE